ncbi:hypothetical protein SteCoe_7822 [Stentor coeruleus]|uniref:Uncharacterized protein n=1 Tax=Stentor coeruleus TaxID=5963 RepID=A0A1R2CLN4_9CILI|nr:hypothetical protein SteCoe_7822 [Stentor coeruleus]
MIFLSLFLYVHASDDCNPDCPFYWLGDYFCDISCMTGPCGYDNGDCLYACLQNGCPNEASDGICDESCNIDYCGYDYGDCSYCGEFCSEELYFNDICDNECNESICNYDNYACGYCNFDCFENMLGNGVCDLSCLTLNCDFDYYDYEYCNWTKIYVTSENATNGDGSSSNPINSLIYALYTLASMYTEILLFGSDNFILYDADFIGFCHITEAIAYAVIRPLYCSEKNILGCYEEGYMPIILASRQPLCLGIRNRVMIKNVIFSQHELFDPYCQDCDYCRYSFTDIDGVIKDDRGNALYEDQYVNSQICDDYSAYWFFKVITDAYFYLENVRFENMRLGMESLIKISGGFLYMTNVNFTNIVTAGNVINASPYFDRMNFVYSGGVVSFINNGYEVIDENPLKRFIYLEYFTEIIIENVVFQYNLYSSKTLGFITIADSLMIKFSNLQFVNNYSKNYLIHIDQSTVEMYLNPINSENYIDNVLISGCRFENNTASKLVYVYYISECQNVQISQCYFQSNAVEENVVLIEYGEVLPSLCIDGNIATGGVIPKKYIIIFSNKFLNNFSGLGMLTIKNLANIQISDLSFNENGYHISINDITLSGIKSQPGAYIVNSLSNFIINTNYFLISLFSNYRVSFENCDFLRNIVPLIIIDNSMTELIFKNSQFQDNLLYNDEWFLSITSQVFLQLEYLEFYNVTYQNQAKGLIYLKATSKNSVYSIKNVYIENSSDAIRAQMLSSLFISNLTIINSTAKLFSGLYFTGTASSLLSISKSYFSYNTGTTFYLTSEVSGSSLLLTLTESDFYKLKSPGLSLDSSLTLCNESVISKVNFIENKSLVLNIASSHGKLVLIMCNFDSNLAKSTSVIKITGSNEVIIDDSIFQYNQAENLVYIYSEDNSTFVCIQNSEIFYNQGTAVKASYAVFLIKDSKFEGNQGKFGTVGYLTTSALGGFYNIEIENNSASENGMIYMILGSYAKINNVVFYKNYVLGKGAGIFADQNSSIIVEWSRFEENSAFQGSSLYIQHCLAISSVQNTIFLKNKAQASGTITILESYLTIKNSTIEENTAKYYPAIECLYYSNLDIYKVTFKSHIGIGGNIGVETSYVIIKNSNFYNASSDYDASVFYVKSSSLLCEGCMIENATSLVESVIYCSKSKCSFNENFMGNINVDIEGSVILSDDMSNLTVENTVISNYNGSGVTISRTSYLAFINSTLKNGSGLIGGGISCTECTSVEISSSTFKNLSSSTYGGCIYLNPLNPPNILIITSSIFSSCSSSLGGAIYIKSQSTIINSSIFTSNNALLSDSLNSGQGGSIFIEDSSNTQQTSIINCSFTKSSASKSGGGIQWYGIYPTITNCLFSKNQAFYGPDISSYPSQLKIPQNRILTLLEIPPGQQISYPIIINILDHYNQTVLTENQGTGQISVTNTLNFSLSGEVKVTARAGVLNFSSILLAGPPNSLTSLSVTGTFSSTLQLINEDFNVFVRECIIGEALVNENSCIVCQVGKYNLKAGDICKQCPIGALCFGGRNIVAGAGYWRYSKNTDMIMECPYAKACLEENADFEKNKCLEGYTGNLCQSCEEGYSRNGENQCTKCLERGKNIVMLLGIIILLILIIIILTASNIKAALKEQSITSVYYKIIINYFQIVMLTISFNLDWPWLVKSMFTVQSQTAGSSEQLFSFDCYLAENMKPFYAKIIILSILPIISGIFSCIFWLSWSIFRITINLKEKIIGSIIVQLFIFQPSLLKFNFAVFNCMEISQGNYYLISDLNIKCWDAKHLKYALGAALPSLIVWCILAPIALLIFLTKYRNELNTKEERFKYGFIYKGYKTERFYWEFITMSRKLTIISAAVFFKNISVNIQALATFLIIIIAYLLQNKLEPYNLEQLNNMEKKSIIVSAVTIYCGLFFLTKDIDEGGKDFMFGIMLMSNLVFLSYWGYYTFGSLIKKIYFKFKCFQKCVKWVVRQRKIKTVPKMDVNSDDEQNNSLASQWANNSHVHIINSLNSPENND